MGVIQVLDDFTIDKIAAGEVIERPASVVKELVENAMDSGATSITIEIKEGGISFIRITDNGSGIAAEDVPAAFLRHATSKIRSAEDLLHIHSLGFRGEALSSIAAVAQVELITKTGKALTGVRYLIAGGKESALEHIGCPEGTTFIVRNLFYNVPARQKFLKTPQTEGAHIYDLIQQLALSHPEISFQFIMNGQNRFHTSGNGNIKDILYTIYGKEVARSLLPIELRDETLTLHITGYIGKPIISRGNRSYENYYINQRYVKSNVIYKAVEDAYKTFTMIHRFPFVCLNFTIDPGQMDVNVHPSKMELRFKQERRLYEVLKNAIRQTLLTKDLIPTASVNPEQKKKVVIEKSAPVGAQPFETARKTVEKRLERRPLPSVEKPAEKRVAMPVTEQVQEALVKPEQAQAAVAAAKETAQIPVPFQKEIQTTTVTAPKEPKPSRVEEQASYTATVEIPEEKPKKPEQLSLNAIPFMEAAARPDHRVIGQLFATYWLIEYDNQLFIMDQHAAHEKVNYERFMNRYKEKQNLFVQQVSPPIVISMTPKEAVCYEDCKDFFADMGFEIEPFGGNEYAIHGVPTDLYGIADQDAFLELLDELMENVTGTDTTMIPSKIATMACKASVKGNQKLTFEEADRLIDELLTLDSPFTCPHGRPTIISMTKQEIERKFKRIQDKN